MTSPIKFGTSGWRGIIAREFTFENVRLASQLTGWRIDIHSESKVRELEEQAKRELAEIEGVERLHQDGQTRELLLAIANREALAEVNARVCAGLPRRGKVPTFAWRSVTTQVGGQDEQNIG